MEIAAAKNGSRASRPHNSINESAKQIPVHSLDAADHPHVSMGSFERNPSGYTPPSMIPDAGGLTPQLTARTSISHVSSLDYRNKQLALLGPMRPQPTKIWKRKFVKLMVVGDSGLGKTTLISALLSKPGEQLQVHDGTNTPLNQFLKDPDSLITRVTWKDEQDKVVWVFRVQDTPGYGDDQDISLHINMIVKHINQQNTKWLEMESAKDRCIDLIDVEDPRVDVCLYCLPPHRLRQNDIRYMAELSKHVPIIPVIMKADTMTIHEAQRFRQEVVNRLQNPALSGIRGKIEMFQFSPSTMERAGLPSSAAMSIPPFVVIASNDINQAALQDDPPTFWPERSYKWGTAEAFNPDHSDLLFLRSLLMAEALEEVSVQKRQRYEDWRQKHLATPFFVGLRRRLVRFVMWTALPAAAVVWAANNGFDQERMKESLRSTGRRIKGKVTGACTLDNDLSD
eukprot:GHUV01028385.1.p1 GENE.GHUV01028385.1~~GHUV01028385.1.p1  ORF type:complete len:454 (+),score=123.94 GHUV01028385.1:250-1611(+)